MEKQQNKAKNNIPLGELLLQQNLITKDQLEYALKVQKIRGKKLGDMIIELGYVKEEDITKLLSERLNVGYVDLSKFRVQTTALDLLPKKYVQENAIIPIENNDKMVVIATNDPMNFYLMDDIMMRTGHSVKFVLAVKKEIERAIERYYANESLNIRSDINDNFRPEKMSILDIEEQLKDDIENAPIVKFVNSLIYNAISSNASDIHIEPAKNNTKIRIRVDGQLIETMDINSMAHNNIVTRIKIMAKMDISEKRIPQDGRIELRENGMIIDMRVSSIPTVLGEKIVIRILGGMAGIIQNKMIGLTPKNEDRFNKIIKSPSGLILVCGPTGSGKTTTLYSILNDVNESSVNIITIEDPVEYRIDGISQIQVNHKIGLTFSSGLRAILRQDPDVVMLGEIRDSETAQTAIKSSITGHLVLSTIHTNSAAGTIPRLVDMGVEPFLLVSSLAGVISQRLLKVLCPKCKFGYMSTKEDMEYLDISEPIKIYKAIGCSECSQTGYKGRVAIYEILPITKKIRNIIMQSFTEDELEEVAKSEGMSTLKEDGVEYVINGTTSIDELVKITYSI